MSACEKSFWKGRSVIRKALHNYVTSPDYTHTSSTSAIHGWPFPWFRSIAQCTRVLTRSETPRTFTLQCQKSKNWDIFCVLVTCCDCFLLLKSWFENIPWDCWTIIDSSFCKTTKYFVARFSTFWYIYLKWKMCHLWKNFSHKIFIMFWWVVFTAIPKLSKLWHVDTKIMAPLTPTKENPKQIVYIVSDKPTCFGLHPRFQCGNDFAQTSSTHWFCLLARKSGQMQKMLHIGTDAIQNWTHVLFFLWRLLTQNSRVFQAAK